jgi:hypothetical protein
VNWLADPNGNDRCIKPWAALTVEVGGSRAKTEVALSTPIKIRIVIVKRFILNCPPFDLYLCSGETLSYRGVIPLSACNCTLFRFL